MDDIEQLRSALDKAPVDHEVVRYANAGHGFHRFVGDDHVPDAADDAWGRTLGWFAKHLT